VATLIVVVDDGKLKMVKDILKAIGFRVHKKHYCRKNSEQATVEAIKDAFHGKIAKVKSVDEFLKAFDCFVSNKK
jgi:thiamine pyrophosphate-dependent acetolactate synthase large subunit-like protein